MLTDSPNPRDYWKVLKHRLLKEGNETVINCNQLKLLAEDGKKRLTLSLNSRGFLLNNFFSIGLRIFMIRDLKNSSLLFRGIPNDRSYRSVVVPRFAMWRFSSPDCTHFVRLSGVTESAFLRNAR